MAHPHKGCTHVTKQQLLDECARRLGDEDPTFKSAILAPAFDFVLLELAQQDCVPLLRSQTVFALSTPAGVVSDNLLLLDTAALVGTLPVRIIGDILVPAWGAVAGRIVRVDDQTFEHAWLGNATNAGQPCLFRLYPSIAQLQLWPAPRDEDGPATAYLDWTRSPTTLGVADEIADVEVVDLPTLLAGLYRVGIGYRDETLNDTVKAEADWQRGVQRMRERTLESRHFGRRYVIRYREF
jgi:hypothetical protein